MLLIIGFALLIVTIFLIHYTPDENKALTCLYLVLAGLTTTFLMFGLIQLCNCAWENENRQKNIEKRAIYIMALEDEDTWKTTNGLVALGEEIAEFNCDVRRANTYSTSAFAPFIKGIVYQPEYVGLEPIPVGETGT